MKRVKVKQSPVKLFYALLSFFLLGALFLAVVYIKQVQDLRLQASYSELNLVQNPSFDDWSNGLPKLWKGNKNFVAQSFDRIDGSSAVAVRGTKSLLELGQYTPGQIAQVVVGIKRDKDYTLTFLTKGGKGQAVIDYSYKDKSSGLHLPNFVKTAFAVTTLPIKTATPLNRKHTISKAFGPNNSYTQVMISFHTNPGLRNGTATLTFMAVGEETVLIDNVVLKETAN